MFIGKGSCRQLLMPRAVRRLLLHWVFWCARLSFHEWHHFFAATNWKLSGIQITARLRIEFINFWIFLCVMLANEHRSNWWRSFLSFICIILLFDFLCAREFFIKRHVLAWYNARTLYGSSLPLSFVAGNVFVIKNVVFALCAASSKFLCELSADIRSRTGFKEVINSYLLNTNLTKEKKCLYQVSREFFETHNEDNVLSMFEDRKCE